MTYKFSILITQEDDWFVAQCPELGVASQGKTLVEAQANLQEAVELYLEDNPMRDQLLSQSMPLVGLMEITI